MATHSPNVLVSWPSAPLTESLVRKSLEALNLPLSITSIPNVSLPLLQWSTYDALDHGLTHSDPANVLMSSYTIRKALIRKHFLSRCLLSYFTKHPQSVLAQAVPCTWDIDICFADELTEMWQDDLWHLGQELETSAKWWILKPGMADRGIGIRLFNSKLSLQQVFEDFEDESDEEANQDEFAVVTSQLRHFVIQEYLSTLLLDPTQAARKDPLSNQVDSLQGHKFHLRAYCVSSGALTVYLYSRILALFAAAPYFPPDDHGPIDMSPHLTNTSLRTEQTEDGVHLLDELIGCRILSCPQVKDHLEIKAEDVASIVDQIADILADVFRAAVGMPVHFQPLPNAFELYGVDFLVVHLPSVESGEPTSRSLFQVKVLEINAEPAIELTGPRLTWILEDLFVAIGKVCVEPFLSKGKSQSKERDSRSWPVGETRFGLRKCLETNDSIL